MEEATTIKILQTPGASPSAWDTRDWLQGYCFQTWRCRHNGVRADGAMGQFIILLPDQDAVIAITAESPALQEEINLVWQYLLPSLQNWAYKDDPDADARLQKQLAGLALPPLHAASSAADVSVNGKTYALHTNDRHLQSIGFSQQGGLWKVTIKDDKGVWPFSFGDGQWTRGTTGRPGPTLTSRAVNDQSGLSPFQVAASYHWKDENTLELAVRYIESPHSEKLVCHFDGDNVRIEDSYSFDYGKAPVILTGTAPE